ncbi:MAG: xanthine dehydrogenase family protein molybdopterin-binding subunit [Alphaproteobacteria bacterium]
MSGHRVLGTSPTRVEDERLLRGLGRFVDDIEVPRALHLVFLRSPHAHAEIVALSTQAARAMPGVVATWTGQDFAARATTLRMAPPIEGLLAVDVPPFPVERVRFAGDPVVAIVAETREAALDAAEAIEVEYRPLPACASIDAARAPDAMRVDPALATNRVARQEFAAGEADAAFAGAHRVVEARFSQHRQTHMPLEPRGCIASWDRGRRHLTIQAGAQAPHPLRSALASRLRLPESQVTVVSEDVGGGFGQKIALLREELACAALAIELGRPVRWREERGENLVAALHAREEAAVLRAAVAADGRLLALEATLEADFGAYCFFPANYMIAVVAMILPGPYRVKAYRYELEAWLTNKCPAGPMRAPMASASWFMDGLMDRIAAELGRDPLDVRRINTIGASEQPWTTATGETLFDVTPAETLEAAAAAIGHEAFRARQREARARGELLGLGYCAVIESTTYGSAFYRKAGIPGSGHEAATIRIEPSGAVLASCGLGGTGQGYETTLAQCVAEGLGCRLADVAIRIGNSDVAPYGMGSRGSRGAAAGGGALLRAARGLRAKVLAIAAARLGLNGPDALDLVEGRVRRDMGGAFVDAGLSLADIARTAHLDPLALPAGMEPGLHLTLAYDPPAMTYANATHACVVAIDGETGALRIERYVVAHDCGTAINPAIVEGQVHGAVAMGLSGAMGEHCAYDAEGQARAGSLMDYALARAADLPSIEAIACDRPNRFTEAGIKGMSEGGVMGAIGALSNAVNDALAPTGRRIDAQPLAAAAIRAALAAP